MGAVPSHQHGTAPYQTEGLWRYFLKWLAPLTGAAVCLALVLAFGGGGSHGVTVVAPTESVCIVNHAPGFFSNEQILRDIPAWEQAANQDFAPAWDTPHVRITISKPSRGCIEALFEKSGPIRGALAFHTVERGRPKIVVYAGTDDYYGYSNSVSFTHELFETLGDPYTSAFNLPWSSYPVVHVGSQVEAIPVGALAIDEVCDPVEAYQFRLHGVAISDFITPNWFHDQVNGGYDFMGVVQEPYTVTHGGYVMFEYNGQIIAVENFRHAGRDADGFYKGEKVEPSQHQ